MRPYYNGSTLALLLLAVGLALFINSLRDTESAFDAAVNAQMERIP